MSAYTLDINTASCEELLMALDDLAKYWTTKKQLAHEFNEGVRYNEIVGALKSRCGQNKQITDVLKNGVYRVV